MSTTPASELPKNFQPKDAEERGRSLWEAGGYFTPDAAAEADPYTIVIPPPNVTGVLHLGHGLVQTIQDVLIRHHRMAGCKTLWVPGTDHAGIATQHVVTEKLRAEGKDRREMGREPFLKEVWAWKDQCHGTITSQIKTLGCSVDWSREAFTLDEERGAAVRKAFKRLYDKGLIYRGQYMVNWDPVSLTALADDEVEYEEEEGSLWHIKYPFADGSGRAAIVATTRPETLLGDTAVAVNPSDERYADVVGAEVELPLTGRRIPIIADDFVKKDFGSGMVKITPAHDPNDFACGQRHGMELIDIMTPDARISDNAPEKYRGMDRYEARKLIIEDLKAAGLLVKTEKHPHRVGRGYRSKSVIEPRVSDQWFVKIKPLAERAMAAVRSGDIRILPKSQENTYFAWMENVRDWCISRQLWWGHRIPVWYKKDDPGQMICWDGEGDPLEVQAAPGDWAQDEDVLDTWFSSALWPFSTLGWPATSAPDLKAFYPTSVLVTGHDILFFWVARMIMMGLECCDEKPFKDVFLHGLIFGKSYYRRTGQELQLIPPRERIALGLDEMDSLPKDIEFKWEKMSKSKGNVIDPLEMFDLFGVDPVRIALVAYSGQGRTIEIDRHRIAGYRNFINKLWNASRLVLMATEDVAPEHFRGGIPEEGLRREDQWILHRLNETITKATESLRAYEFDQYVNAIYHFLWNEYCDWYLELIKGRVYARDVQADDPTVLTAKVTALAVLEQVLRLLHPVIPYTTEDIWQLLRERLAGAQPGETAAPIEAMPQRLSFLDGFAKGSICVAPWPADNGFRAAEACEQVALIQRVVGGIRNIRGEMGVPQGMEVDVMVEHPDEATRGTLANALPQVRTLCLLNTFSVASSQGEAPFAAIFVDGDLRAQVLLPAELREQEIARLDKEKGKLEKGRDGVANKLKNEKFVNNAPADVVDKEKEKLAKYEADLAVIEEKLAKLGSGG